MADIEITAADGHRFAAHRADPAGDPLGAIVVIQEIFGVNRHIRQVVERFAQAGFVAAAPAVFDRVERGVELDYDADGVTKGRGIAWGQLPIDDALLDVAATADVLASAVGGPQRVGVVGYCYGGMLAAAALSRIPERFAAGVAYYPSQAATLLTEDLPARPLMMHLGDEDQGVTIDDGLTLAARWPDAVAHRYEGAGHGFNCDLRPGYHAESAATAWERTVAFFTAELAG